MDTICGQAAAIPPDPYVCCPADQRARMQALLAGEDPAARVCLLAGFYSMALRRKLEARGFEVISCDYRLSEGPGMHYVGDVRSILHARWWAAVYAAPPCKNLAWAGSCAFDRKRAYHLQFDGIMFAVLLWCAPADAIILEQPGSELAVYLGLPTQVLHPKDLKGGNGEQKLTMLWIRGWRPLTITGTGEGSWQRSHNVSVSDENRREIEKAFWSDALCEAIASEANPDTTMGRGEQAEVPDPASLRRRIAEQWEQAGNHLPEWWDDPLARNPGRDEPREIAQMPDGRPWLVPDWLWPKDVPMQPVARSRPRGCTPLYEPAHAAEEPLGQRLEPRRRARRQVARPPRREHQEVGQLQPE